MLRTTGLSKLRFRLPGDSERLRLIYQGDTNTVEDPGLAPSNREQREVQLLVGCFVVALGFGVTGFQLRGLFGFECGF